MPRDPNDAAIIAEYQVEAAEIARQAGYDLETLPDESARPLANELIRRHAHELAQRLMAQTNVAVDFAPVPDMAERLSTLKASQAEAREFARRVYGGDVMSDEEAIAEYNDEIRKFRGLAPLRKKENRFFDRPF